MSAPTPTHDTLWNDTHHKLTTHRVRQADIQYYRAVAAVLRREGPITAEAAGSIATQMATIIDHLCDALPTPAALALDPLAHEIAYHAARSDIEVYCDGEYSLGNPPWFDTAQIIYDRDEPETIDTVSRAERYLEGRGLLARWPGSEPERAHWVRILELPEPPTLNPAASWPFPAPAEGEDAELDSAWPINAIPDAAEAA